MVGAPVDMILRDIGDGVTLEEVSVLVGGVLLFTSEGVEWKVTQDKKLKYGAGRQKAHGRTRGPKKYELSFDCKAVNMALMQQPENWQPSQGPVKTFTMPGDDKTYKDLLDLRNLTITLLFPDQDGTILKRTFLGFEFNEDGGSLSLSEAEGRKLSGEATEARGLV